MSRELKLARKPTIIATEMVPSEEDENLPKTPVQNTVDVTLPEQKRSYPFSASVFSGLAYPRHQCDSLEEKANGPRF